MPSTTFLALAFLIPLTAFYLAPQTQEYIFSLRAMLSSNLHVAPHEINQPAFLYVTAEPGELATDEEFNCSLSP